jgi:hypothetical protein
VKGEEFSHPDWSMQNRGFTLALEVGDKAVAFTETLTLQLDWLEPRPVVFCDPSSPPGHAYPSRFPPNGVFSPPPFFSRGSRKLS